MKKLLLITGFVLMSLFAKSQAPVLTVYITIVDSVIFKDSVVTYMMKDTLTNTEWVRNLLAEADSVLFSYFSDTSKFADSSGYADTSGIALNVSAGGSNGDIQYNNSGVLGGAPMSTDGTDMTMDGDLYVPATFNIIGNGFNTYIPFGADFLGFSTGNVDDDLTEILIDRNGDVFSLDAILFQMIRGDTLFGFIVDTSGAYYYNGGGTFYYGDITNPNWLTTKHYVDNNPGGAAGSNGDIQYNNSGALGGAPMTTDGTDIDVGNDLDVTTDLRVGGDISSSYSAYPIFQTFDVTPGEFNYSWADIINNDLVSLIVEPTTPYSFVLETDWNDIHHQMVFDNRTVSPRMFYQLITYDQVKSHGFSMDTNSFDIFIEYPGTGDPQYRFTEDTFGIEADLIVEGYIERWRYEAAAYLHPDSVITTSITTAWEFLGAGENNKFTNIEADGFSLDGDTLLFTQRTDDPRDSIEFHISYSCESATSNVNQTVYIGIFTKHSGDPDYSEKLQCTRKSRTTTASVYYPGPNCSTIPIYIKDGDKIQIRAKGGASTTLSTGSFGIYLYEE